MARNATAMALDADVQLAIDTMVVTYPTLPEKALPLGFTSADSHCRANNYLGGSRAIYTDKLGHTLHSQLAMILGGTYS